MTVQEARAVAAKLRRSSVHSEASTAAMVLDEALAASEAKRERLKAWLGRVGHLSVLDQMRALDAPTVATLPMQACPACDRAGKGE